ncbi:DUF389 domain-containing protein [Streptomyces halstedii]|uniref:DUF389 domain-containing protein n=1 Tax=Streptomyces TaxID=1883 RepID=UPI00048F1D5F|nr:MULTISPECIES: DUF389 domain-containing protein [Streptomyces]MYR74627.1 DUF389 domain-containing protein [Streptomyces sp. SID4925]MYY15633.1 DUF389 domain-containing protein [Streptomyces sp. SID4912]SBU90105.1 uncharacterized hydrophobic domain-containing protein [Streptomyces sp. OspMP-M45]SCD52809.1 uncharacterized hydrophobic domain-containing protein [Streptomyces sp. PpalLS-921]SCD58780.1 uncharacterized hydrophobic domain-containing protein [Streptomyces sp. DpondAA-D4]
MLHLRLIVPADRTDEVVELLERTVGATHLAVLTGAARSPAGDLVLCDVAREAGDELIDALRGLGIDRSGSITAENMELTLSAHADEAERRAPGDSADAVLWEELTEVTHEESTFSATYVAFLGVAMMLAACGVMLDNVILIVGAMAVGPEFGPLAGISTALVQRAPRLVATSLWALIGGFAAAMVLTAGFVRLMDALGLFTARMVTAERPNTTFIWHPDQVSFVVALLAGIAGTLSLTSAKSGALIGVAISVTTVPAAANAAVAFSYQDLPQAWGASAQLLANLGGIVLAGTLTLLVQKALWAVQRRRDPAVRPGPSR